MMAQMVYTASELLAPMFCAIRGLYTGTSVRIGGGGDVPLSGDAT